MITYISIGNSDDKLTQAEWSAFWDEVRNAIYGAAHKIHGEWASDSVAMWQNACWCVEFTNTYSPNTLKPKLTEIRKRWKQDSIAWADVPETEFL